jgi:hypothetical protein
MQEKIKNIMTKQDIKEKKQERHWNMGACKGIVHCGLKDCPFVHDTTCPHTQPNSLPSHFGKLSAKQQIARSLEGFDDRFYDRGKASVEVRDFLKQELETCMESARKEAVEEIKRNLPDANEQWDIIQKLRKDQNSVGFMMGWNEYEMQLEEKLDALSKPKGEDK